MVFFLLIFFLPFNDFDFINEFAVFLFLLEWMIKK